MPPNLCFSRSSTVVETSQDKWGARIENRTQWSRYFFFKKKQQQLLYTPQLLHLKCCCRCHVCGEKARRARFEAKHNSGFKTKMPTKTNKHTNPAKCVCVVSGCTFPCTPLPLRRQHIPAKSLTQLAAVASRHKLTSPRLKSCLFRKFPF